MTKAMTLRLETDQADAIEKLAEVDNISVAEAVRRAIADHIEARRADPDFQERLRASLDRHREILEKLADS